MRPPAPFFSTPLLLLWLLLVVALLVACPPVAGLGRRGGLSGIGGGRGRAQGGGLLLLLLGGGTPPRRDAPSLSLAPQTLVSQKAEGPPEDIQTHPPLLLSGIGGGRGRAQGGGLLLLLLGGGTPPRRDAPSLSLAPQTLVSQKAEGPPEDIQTHPPLLLSGIGGGRGRAQGGGLLLPLLGGGTPPRKRLSPSFSPSPAANPPLSLDVPFLLLREMVALSRAQSLQEQARKNRVLLDDAGRK
ncbi:urocortin [Anolis sagrei]|uniref:urocortin n=1 Tax=Anolis sagrei TaxID=38937 RepID=UPI00351FB0BD